MMTVTVKKDTKEVERLLAMVPVIAQRAAFEKGIRPAANIVKARVRQLAPRSSQTHTTRKWSRKTKSERSGEKPLRDAVGIKMLKGGRTSATALVGFRWPDGNKGHFLLPMKKHSRTVVLWGKHTGQEARKGDDFLRRAFDQTKDAQMDAFTSGVKREVDRKLKELGIG